jgi:protein-S-isoprenylcysteine O-methyltransferase Ste14
MVDGILTGKDIDLLKERSKPPGDAKEWDKQILKLSALITIVAYVIAGLDSGRYQWSPRIPWGAWIAGIVVMVTGQFLFLKSKETNKFFSSVVRIQSDRGHTVCETGLYRFVRHPGYLGMITSWVAFPLVLGSFWSGIPVFVAVILLLVRTRLEDRTLIEELAGYSQYAQRTCYKLVPGIW